MQYFKNQQWRAGGSKYSCQTDMFPLCRSDRTTPICDTPARQAPCVCQDNTQNNSARTERSGLCGCPGGRDRDDSSCGRCGQDTSARTDRSGLCGCRNERDRDDSSCGRCGQDTSARTDRSGLCGCPGGRDKDDSSCGLSCCQDTPTAETYGCTGLAMAFVPEQDFIDLNDAEESLCRGTLFRQLDMPFYGPRRRNCK